MGLVNNLFYFLSPYTDSRERSVGLFFKRLTEHTSQARARTDLDALLQRNIAVINLWTEYQYKGYRYLRKSERKRLYGNLDVIAEDFKRFYMDNTPNQELVERRIYNLGLKMPTDERKIILLQAIMDYFSPARGVYEYRESSSFGRLLRNPSHEKLIGDCNQIVTIYIYLYSLFYDVRDLKVRTLPGHVALHYDGVDIEATSGIFANYTNKEGNKLLPIEEIVSINLLDVSDSYLSQHEVSAESILQSSRFAFILSHSRDVVVHNLDVAYSKVISSLMDRHNYPKALKVAVASKDMMLLGIVGNNGALYEMQHHNYASARRFAQYAPKKEALMRDAWHSEGVYHYQAKRYRDAIKAFERINDHKHVRQSYEALFFEEQKKLGKDLTTESVKKYAAVIKQMHMYAKKSGNNELIEYANNLRKAI